VKAKTIGLPSEFLATYPELEENIENYQAMPDGYVIVDEIDQRKIIALLRDTGLGEIVQERQEQIEKHGRTVDWDVKTNNQCQLSIAASYLTKDIPIYRVEPEDILPEGWDLERWEKICAKPYMERLIIAGTFIAAELDRLKEINRK